MLLKDKVVVISGVGPGLGQALSRLAAEEGASVVLAARNQDFIGQLRDWIVAGGGRAIALSCDVTDERQCLALAEHISTHVGDRIHGLVNSAYYHGDWSFLHNCDAMDVAKAFDVNCLGALRLTRACSPYLRDGGAVVNISTMATVQPFGGEFGTEMGYAATKGALNTLSKYMASELGPLGIRVNLCRMGWIHGAPVEQHIDACVDAGAKRKDVIADITRNIPIGIIPPEDDCARAILMLLSDYSRVVSGASIDINGGQWMAP